MCRLARKNTGKDRKISVNTGKDRKISVNTGKDRKISVNTGKDRKISVKGGVILIITPPVHIKLPYGAQASACSLFFCFVIFYRFTRSLS